MRAAVLAMLAAGPIAIQPHHPAADEALCLEVEPDAGTVAVLQPDGGTVELLPATVRECRGLDARWPAQDDSQATAADWVTAAASVAAVVIAGVALAVEVRRK